MPVGLVPGLTKSHLEGSVFRYVQETLGLKLMGSYRVVRAMKPGELDNSIFTANRPIRCWRWSRLSIWRMARRWIAHCHYRYDHGGIILVNNG
ncbi:putative transcriptional regulator [Klebsiella pneumoniae]|uniref:Putative transcriptional regulator n=1 Tax=Klebsiella pneumoniae TaxID=573 RepID=A0A377W8M8_KLEPN|nr:putative transcriptional regulator [Klebsiella pneumoniae]